MVLIRTALTACALAASVTVAMAQNAQDHEAHHPDEAQAQTQSQPATPAPGGAQTPAAPGQPGGMMGSGGMMGGQGPQGMMGGQGMMQGCQPMMGNASSPMAPAMRQMQQSLMGARLTGDPDHDFAAMMVPHHQGAIDMARAELKDGKDPEMRKLAQAIVESQEKEVKELYSWLAKTASK